MRILVALAILTCTSPSFASDRDDIAKLVDMQDQLSSGSDVYTDEAILIPPPSGPMAPALALSSPRELVELIAPPSTSFSGGGVKDRQIVIARDGKAAWASFTARVDVEQTAIVFRVSDVLVKTPKGWRVAVTAWSLPVANDVVNKEARAGKRSLDDLEGKDSDATLVAAFTKLATDGLDPTAAARKDLVAFGSGPGERTTGGAILAKAWKAAWAKRVTVASIVARVAPSGTTGWIAATVALDKKTYKVPFLVFCVFDKTATGEWSLVHIQFAV